MQEATPWIQVALNLVDMMGKLSVKPEVGLAIGYAPPVLILFPRADISKVEENPS